MTFSFRFVALLVTSITIVSAACGSGDGGSTSDRTPTSEPGTPADFAAIRQLNLATLPAVTTLVAQLGGGDPDVPAAKYADLTGDGREEAVLPIASGGTLGNIAYLVLTLKSGQPSVILTATRDRASIGGVSMSVEDGTLYKYVGKYGPEDPRCCPSVLVKTTYRWDGTMLQVAREEETTANAPKQ